MIDIKEKLEIMVATHIVNVDSNPYIENKMIEDTIRSSHRALNLENTKFTICPDARLKKSHPILMNKYENYLNNMCSRLRLDGINVSLREENGETLRGNWVKFIKECKRPYMLFLEHDWLFKKQINVKDILNCFDNNQNMNYLKLPKYDLTQNFINSLASSQNWDWIFEEDYSIQEIPVSKISFFSGNPHFARVSFSKNYVLPNLEKYCPLHLSKGLSHLEKDMLRVALQQIDSYRTCGSSNDRSDWYNNGKYWGHLWDLSSGGNVGKGCLECKNAVIKQHTEWGNYCYGIIGETAVVGHSGEWCRKK